VIETLSGRQVLVTGGCGFIGLNLVAQLLAQGAIVTVVDLDSANWHNLPATVTQLKADVLDRQSLAGTLAAIEIVYHLAARTDIDGRTVEDYRVNYLGAQNVIEACAEAGRTSRFVFYSTQLVVGLFNETRFIDETEPFRTKTAYGQSKIEGEKLVISDCSRLGLPYTIIRPTSVYGPWGEAPYREFFRVIKRRRYFHVGRADNLVSWVYVKNLVDLTILASLSPECQDQTYFGNDFHPYTMREIVDAVARYYGISVPTVPSGLVTILAYLGAIPKRLGVDVPIYPFRLANIKANYCYDIQKSAEIGFMPRYDLGAGVRETLDWYENRRLI
jgi:nucleoside-diphosphate-sugar epimerase